MKVGVTIQGQDIGRNIDVSDQTMRAVLAHRAGSEAISRKKYVRLRSYGRNIGILTSHGETAKLVTIKAGTSYRMMLYRGKS